MSCFLPGKRKPLEVLYKKKLFLKISQYSQENNKETPTHVFSREYCKNFKNTYFKGHLQTAASTKTIFTSLGNNNYPDIEWVETEPSQYLLVQRQQGKPSSNVWNLFKVNNKGTKINVFTVINKLFYVFPLSTLNKCPLGRV